MKDKMATIKGRPPFVPDESEGKTNFMMNFKCPKTFSENDFFKTVFISGDDMVKEMQAMKAKEIDDWKKKVIVENEHFTVNTRQPKHID